jgi:hypothetical protein
VFVPYDQEGMKGNMLMHGPRSRVTVRRP